MGQLNRRIKELRKTAEVSQETFAYSLGVSRGHISNLETGAAIPSKQLIKLICRVWSIREEWLCEGKEPISNEPDLTAEHIQKLELERILDGSKYRRNADRFQSYTWTIDQITKFILSAKKFEPPSDHPKFTEFIKAKKALQESLGRLHGALYFDEIKTFNKTITKKQKL